MIAIDTLQAREGSLLKKLLRMVGGESNIHVQSRTRLQPPATFLAKRVYEVIKGS